VALKTRLGLVILSAGLLVLCYPPFGAWPLAVVALVPLLLAVRGSTPSEAFFLGMAHGVLFYAGSLGWLFHVFAIAAVPLFCILGLFTGFFCLLLRALNRKEWPPWISVLLTAVLWTGLEFYRCELFFLRFPWMSVGSALGPTWLSPLVGVYGATLVIVLAASGLFYRKTRWAGVGLALAILACGTFRPGRVDVPEGEGVAVVVVQAETGYIDGYMDLARTQRQEHPDLVLWPEYALPYDVRKRPNEFDRLKAFCADLDTTLVMGTQTVVGPGSRQWRNTALTMNADGVIGEYYKARPVHFFNDGIPGTDFDPIQTSLGALGTPICFDCDNATVARDITACGAEFFCVPVFDAASWGATQHVQHAALARLRAAENGRWFACAASSGVSQVIDPHGRVHASLPPLETGAFTSRIGRRHQLTLFTRAGWLVPWFALVATIGFSLLEAATALRRRRGVSSPVATTDPEV
jgi:apolipoprotein N-acyltransferase